MDSEQGTRLYWRTWGGLLALTLVMLAVDRMSGARLALFGVLLAAMAAKATLIALNFMHLRFEPRVLVVSVVVGIVATALVLFGLLAIDGIRILRLSSGA